MLTTLDHAPAINHGTRQGLVSPDANFPLVCFWALAGLVASAAIFLTDAIPAAVLQQLG